MSSAAYPFGGREAEIDLRGLDEADEQQARADQQHLRERQLADDDRLVPRRTARPPARRWPTCASALADVRAVCIAGPKPEDGGRNQCDADA